MAALVDTVGMEHPGGRLSWGGVKEFFDGSLGSRTALMHAPYEDDSNTSGTLALDLKAFRKDLEGADASGLQVAVHAIGDKAVDAVLDAYDALLAKRKRAALSKDEHKLGRGIDGRRHRIEHAQHLSGPDVPHRLAALGVVVTPNPLHRPSDAAILKPRLGAERCRWAYPFKSLLASGVRCAFATDWPVVPLEPLGTLGAAVGAVGEGDAPLQEELVTPEEGLRGMTRDAAYAGFQEGSIGMMRAGMKADFVIWDGDVLEAARHGLGRPKVVATFVDGVREYGEELAQGTGVKDEL